MDIHKNPCGQFWVYDLDDIEDGDSNDDVSSQSQYDAATWKCASCADCFRVTCYEKRPSLRDWNAVPSYLDVAIRRLSHRFIAARPASHAAPTGPRPPAPVRRRATASGAEVRAVAAAPARSGATAATGPSMAPMSPAWPPSGAR